MNHLNRFFTPIFALIITLTLAFTAYAHGERTVKSDSICDFDEAYTTAGYGWSHPGYRTTEKPDAKCTKDTVVTIKLFEIDKEVITPDDVNEEIRAHDCRPSTWVELMSLGAQHYDEYRYHTIVATGSVWEYTPSKGVKNVDPWPAVSSLHWDEKDGRNLNLIPMYWSGNTIPKHIFAGTCNISKKPKPKAPEKEMPKAA